MQSFKASTRIWEHLIMPIFPHPISLPVTMIVVVVIAIGTAYQVWYQASDRCPDIGDHGAED